MNEIAGIAYCAILCDVLAVKLNNIKGMKNANTGY